MILRHDNPGAGAVAMTSAEIFTPPTVLVVDHALIIRQATARLIRAAGYRTHGAENGLEAQWLLATERVDLVITELGMPVCDGWKLIAHCRARHPEKPVLILSGEAPGQHPDVELWSAAFLTKPVASGELLAAIDRLISRPTTAV